MKLRLPEWLTDSESEFWYGAGIVGLILMTTLVLATFLAKMESIWDRSG